MLLIKRSGSLGVCGRVLIDRCGYQSKQPLHYHRFVWRLILRAALRKWHHLFLAATCLMFTHTHTHTHTPNLQVQTTNWGHFWQESVCWCVKPASGYGVKNTCLGENESCWLRLIRLIIRMSVILVMWLSGLVSARRRHRHGEKPRVTEPNTHTHTEHTHTHTAPLRPCIGFKWGHNGAVIPSRG